MKVPRFRVATCEGYRIGDTDSVGASRPREAGISATVCDSLNLWREIKTYRSEDRVFRQGHNARRGREGALKDAKDHAAHLNAMHRRALHTERVRAGRAERRDNGKLG